MSLPPDHPALAVIAPPRLDRFRSILGLSRDDPIEADFTGWSKLALLTPANAVLFPRDHTQVEALRRDVAALRAIEPLALPEVPRVQQVIEDPALSAYPVLVLDRLPGVPLSGLLDAIDERALGDLFGTVGALAARWHSVDTDTVGTLPRRASLDECSTLATELELDPQDAAAASRALERARSLEPVLVHGDLHEGQLLVSPEPPHELTAVLDWQTARVDHPFVEFDLGEWGTALWRAHRSRFRDLRARAWSAYAAGRALPDDLGIVFEWHHATSHARRLLGIGRFPVDHAEGVVGTLAEARQRVLDALAELRRS